MGAGRRAVWAILVDVADHGGWSELLGQAPKPMMIYKLEGNVGPPRDCRDGSEACCLTTSQTERSAVSSCCYGELRLESGVPQLGKHVQGTPTQCLL